MRRKISAIFVTLVMCISGIVIIPDTIEVKADSGTREESSLDMNLIYSVSENLSNVIFDAYEDDELHKGRAFGSKGERFAADYIYDMMNDIGLSNVQKDRIENVSGDDLLIKSVRGGDGNLTTKLEVLNRELILNNSGDIATVDCYISPLWNESQDDNSYDKNLLTHNFSYNTLNIVKSDNYSCSDEFLHDIFPPNIYNLSFWNKITDFALLFYTIQQLENEFEEEYDFSFDTINPNDNSTFPSFLRDATVPEEDFVFIEECPKLHPTIQELPSYEDKENFNELFEWVYLAKTTKDKLRMKAWHLVYPNCKGLIWYDYLDDSFDTGYKGTYFPVIYVNGSVGTQIAEDVDSFTIDFYINQRWNTSVESYNVIGQITGEDPSKTVIVGCLYDSMWCQGTVDSAIGVGIMLSTAKYMKELQTTYGITPKYTVKFIAWAGEEYGVIGAYHYDVTHADEDIWAVIDLNQLGYNQTEPLSVFNVATNRIVPKVFDPFTQDTLNKLVENVNYKERTGDNTDIRTLWTPMGSLSDEFVFAISRYVRPLIRNNLKTVMFLKDLGWFRHHRDGMDHTEGDSMKHVDWNDVNVTAEMVWNVTKYFTVDPDCSFQSTPSVTKIDTNDDSYYDKVEVTFTANTTMPQDHIKVRTVLHPVFSLEHPLWCLLHRYQDVQEYTITHNQGVTDTLTIQLPQDAPQYEYQLQLFLYNSTGDVNIILDNENDQGVSANENYEPPSFYMYPPTGPPTTPDTVSGPENEGG